MKLLNLKNHIEGEDPLSTHKKRLTVHSYPQFIHNLGVNTRKKDIVNKSPIFSLVFNPVCEFCDLVVDGSTFGH